MPKKKDQNGVVYRAGKRCFNKSAVLPADCSPLPEDPLILVVESLDPKSIARALWTEGIKAVIARPEAQPDDVLELRARMTECSFEDCLLIGQYAIGEASLLNHPETLRETAILSQNVRRRTVNRLSALFQEVAGIPPELGKTMFRPAPQDSDAPRGHGFHDDFIVTLAAIQTVYGAGTDWVKGYQNPEDVKKRRSSGNSRFYTYGSQEDPDKTVQVLSAEEGDIIFFFGRDACAAPPAFPAFVHSSPPIQGGGKDSRLTLAAYTKKHVDFPECFPR